MANSSPLDSSDQPPPAALVLTDLSGVIRHADPGAEWWLGESGSARGRLPELAGSEALQEALREVSQGEAQRQVRLRLRQRLVTAVVGRIPGEPVLSVMLTPAARAVEGRDGAQLRTTIESVISGFAHEVRNPIAAILSITEAALAQMPSGTPSSALLARIPSLVTRVDKLIKESLVYGHPRSPRRSAEPLRGLIQWAIELAQMERSGVHLDVRVEPGLGSVLVDAEQAEQVLVNLLCNARDAARSAITLSAWEGTHSGQGRGVTIEVSDDGPGVSEQHRGQIFEPFFTTKAHGTGLGLPIARELARLNGGELVLHTTSERGSVFRLYLEACAAPGQQSPANAA